MAERHIELLEDGGTIVQGEIMATDNEIKTSRYNALSFVPRALFEQFRRIANMYFLVLGAIMLIGQYTGIYDTSVEPISCLTPLGIVLCFSIFKEGYEDTQRHKADRAVNRRIASTITRKGVLVSKLWKDITVGTIVLVPPDEEIPADMVLLACSERGSMAGLRQAVGYVETSSIDGETNLKIKLPLSWMIQEDQFEDVILIQGEHISGIEQFRGKMDFEAPNKNIHSLNGSVGLDVLGVTHPVSEKNFLIRGSILRCSSWAVGVAVYTGKDTKVSLNARAPPSKLSVVDRIVNHLLWIVLSLMFALCILSTALALMWRTSNSSARYLCLSKDDDAGGDTGSDTDGGCENGDTNNFLMFFTFTTLFNNFVCISMYITLEVVYYVQAYFIASDLRMYCSQTDSPAEARTSNMNSDLGQVQYIFTDKTGTLTKNSMVVRRVSVDGLVFGAPLGVNGDDQALTMASSDVYDFSGQSSQDILRDSHPQYVWNPTSSLKARAWGARPSLVTQEILLVMAACNTALITPPSDFRNSRDSDGRITPQVKQDLDSELPRGSVMGLTDLGRCIQAESADEAAMVVFAASEGDVLLCNRTPAEIILLNAGQLARLPLLAVNEFDSVRKRMSVVVRWRGRAILLCKGADSSVFGAGVMDKNMLSAQDHVGAFASNGLRTLVFAKRYLSEDELSVWLPQYHEALSTVVGRAERLRDVAEALEYRLEVLGCVGIEDELQDDVQASIRTLQTTGIKLWMLTGDKAETAISVAQACALVPPCAEIERLLNITDPKELRFVLIRADADFELLTLHSDRLDDLQAMSTADSGDERYTQRYVLVDGESCITAQDHNELSDKFVSIMRHASVVIAARVSPLQKASFVRMIKHLQDAPVTLAIGDGANDVSMLHEAQIGVGICGREGRHAANNSDFAVAQFRFLVPLLLVHGRWDYIRSSKVVLYSFYKNIVLVSILFFYCAYNGWSGTALLESMVYSGYNFYLGLPIIAVGIFDQDVPAEFALRHPRIAYATGLYREFLNFPTMSRWTVSAFLQGLLLFAIAFRAFAGRAYAMDLSFDMTTHNGTVVGLYGDGYIVYTCLVFAMQCKVASMTCTWTIWNVAAWTLSFLGYFSFTLLYSLFPEIDAWYMVPEIVIGEQQFWLVILLVCTTFCIIDGLTNFLVSYFAPTADLILRMMYAGDSTASPRHFALWASWPRFTSSDLLTIGTTKPVEMKKESEQLASEDMSKPLLGHEVSQKQHASA